MTTTPDHEPSAATAMGRAAAPARASVATDVALVATFAAFIAVCALLPAIPVAGIAVPITLQTFGVMLAGAVLGARRGALAALLYLAVGLAGLPVFSQGNGGLGVLAGASAGYLLAFPVAAAVAGGLVTLGRRVRASRLPLVVFGACTAGSLLVTHPLGITVMGARAGLAPAEAITAGAAFLPGDVVKNLLVAVVATAVFRAFPDMLRRRR